MYFKSLDNEEQEKIKEKFLQSKDSLIYKKASKIYKISIFGIIFAIFSFTFDFIYYASVFNLILDGVLFVISIIYFFKMKKVRDKEINNYALKNKEK